MKDDTAKDIDNFFGVLGGGVKEAGRKRNEELVARQGYLDLAKVEAAQLFQAQHPDWSWEHVDGKYRFFPPKKETSNIVQEPNILDKFKEVNKNFNGVVVASINILEDGTKCRYSLRTTDKQGVSTLVQEEVLDFNGKFSMEILPSIYYAISGGLPVDMHEKTDKSSLVYFSNVDQNRFIQLGNLNMEQLKLVRDMKLFVDDKLGLNVPLEEGRKF